MLKPSISYLLFSQTRIQKAIEAIEKRPRMTRREFSRLTYRLDVLTSRLDELSKIRKLLDGESRAAIIAVDTRLKSLSAEIEPLRETWKQMIDARAGRDYIYAMLAEVIKVIDLLQVFDDIESGK